MRGEQLAAITIEYKKSLDAARKNNIFICEGLSAVVLVQPTRFAQVSINLSLNARVAIETERDASGFCGCHQD